MARRSHEEQVRIACDAGIRWIQLRVKDKSVDECLQIAEAVKKITDNFNVTLIINDSLTIAREIDADGVHLGKQDESIDAARKILGDEKIIGYSAHSFSELQTAKNFNVDYFGLGPVRFTTTKKNLDDILGLEGTEQTIRQARAAGISLPIISIGGIELHDISRLINAGANGIAVSSAINLSHDPSSSIKKFLQQLEISKLMLLQVG